MKSSRAMMGASLFATAMLVSTMEASAVVSAGNAYIYKDGTAGTEADVTANLTNHLTSAAYSVSTGTGVAGSDTLPTLSGFKQVWDVRYNNVTVLTTGDQTKYLSYLQGGGTLFLMGENVANFATRDNSILNFIQLAGGGTMTITSPANTETVQGSVATTPNAISTITFLAAGGVANPPGTGTCLTIDNSGKCAAIGFGGHTLANARSGALVTVFDVNFLLSGADATSQLFIDNLIQYLNIQGDIGARPFANFVPVSNTITHGVATTLDGLLAASSINANMAAAVGALSGLPDDQRAIAMNRLTPTANNALVRLGEGATTAGISNIESRLDGIRNAGTLAQGEPSYENLKIASIGPLQGILENKELKNGVWGKFFGGEMRQNAQDGYAGYGAGTWGLTFGADTRLPIGTVVGGAFTYSKTDLDQHDFLTGSGNDMENEQLTGYLDHNFGRWYLDGFVSYGIQRYKSQRDTNVTGVANGDYNGNMLAAKLGAGMPFALTEKTVLTPFATLEYDRMTQDGYTEYGAGPLDLMVDKNSAERIRSGLGARLTSELEVKGVRVRPSMHVQWLHNFENDGITTTASFTGGGAAFSTPGQAIERDAGNIGAGLLFSMGKNAALSLRYDFESGNGYQNQTGQAICQVWF